MFSLLVVSDRAYYNVAVQEGYMFYVAVQPCLAPLALALSQWERELRLYSWSYVCARSHTRGA